MQGGVTLSLNNLIQEHQRARFGRLEFPDLADRTLADFVGSGLQRFPCLDIRPDTCSCTFFAEEKALALGLGHRAWSWTAELRR